MNIWETIVVGLAEIASVTGPVLLIHHKRIGAILGAINEILTALAKAQPNVQGK